MANIAKCIITPMMVLVVQDYMKDVAHCSDGELKVVRSEMCEVKECVP